MALYAVGFFESSKSGSPYQFVCKRVSPEGPFAILRVSHQRIMRPEASTTYLFELEDWHSIDQRSQFVTKIIARLSDVRFVVHEALKGAEWEMAIERGRRQTRIVGGVLKTEYGYFNPRYDNGTRPNGQDESPMIWLEACQCSSENPYGEALGSTVAQDYLFCVDSDVLKRAGDAGIAKQDLGDMLREKHSG